MRFASLTCGLVLSATIIGCATGESDTGDFTPPPPDAQAESATEAGADADTDATQDVTDDTETDAAADAPLEVGPDVEPDALPDVTPDSDVDADIDADIDAGTDAQTDADAPCPTGYAGPACEDCATGYFACGDQCIDDCASCTNAPYACNEACIASCAACTGQQATCEATSECVDDCASCSGACTECPNGFHACSSGCHADVADDPAAGCMYTCDDLPCAEPANGNAVCTLGACDFTCDTANGFQKSGGQCVCDTANGFVEDPTLHICVCDQGTKGCVTFCASVDDPSFGCSSPYCSPCPSPAHAATVSCDAAGDCDFACDAAHGYVKNAAGTACVCPAGMFDNGVSCQCPASQKLCAGSCVSSLLPDHGCAAASCDPCSLPPHAMATNCLGPNGTCGFACDEDAGYVVNTAGNDCTCAAGLVDYGTYCGCPGGQKVCNGACVDSNLPAYGCAGSSCTACAEPAHSTANCSGPGGTCGFSCDASGHWIASGNTCVCATGWKDCGGTACVDATSTANGCSGASCVACPLPAHAISTSCGGAGGTCDFACDAAGHWMKSGDQCVCEAGYQEVGGACVPACPGTTYGSSCYWYVSNPSSWDAAQGTCAASGGSLVSIADSAENAFVRTLASSTFWIGLRDWATVNTSVSADDCTYDVWLSADGGSYTGSANIYDDIDPCGISSAEDDIFGLAVTQPGIYVFSTSNSSYDTVLGLYGRIADTSGYVSCIGSSIECSDDEGPGSRSLIIQYLGAGDYTVVMDGYSGAWGNYVLDVRRFEFIDGASHGWENWASEQPDNAGSSEDCTELMTSGLWNDNNCAVAQGFVCERSL